MRGAFVDSGFLSMFSFPLLEGNSKNCLKNNYSIVITQQLAKKLFGIEEPLGKIIKIDSSDHFTVTGVLKDLPINTTFDFEYLIPWTYMTKLGWDDQEWEKNTANTYVLLKPGTSHAAFDSKLKDVIKNHADKTHAVKTEEFSQPLRRLYLYSKSENGQLVGGRIVIVKLFATIAVFILLIACINFMNLSTARSEKRAKEVGIRKVVGAFKCSLIMQFIGESLLISFFSFLIAFMIVQISINGFDEIVGKTLAIDYANPFFWIWSFVLVLLAGVIAGSYPAFYLASSRPASVLKGEFRKVSALITPRKVLVVLQFTFAIVLIICTLIVERQIQFTRDRETGYNKNNLVYTFT
ncbi:MAG TPA: ABC transporter permease, partial [Puia sp.]|nr:ABC transporter permease [Puia sp.]